MPRGICLSIGLNSIDPRHYGSSGELRGCEYDALDIQLICDSEGYESRVLLTRDATRDAVLGQIADVASVLKTGDSFVLAYSGHGSQVPDQDGDEDDGRDETWCLYDGQLLDDEIYLALNAFDAGVRILAVADCCHSGSDLKAFPPMLGRATLATSFTWDARNENTWPVAKFLPEPLADRVYLRHRGFYDRLAAREGLKEARSTMKASAILISACQDDELAYDGALNGDFTAALKTVWNGGVFRHSHRAFHKAIRAKLTRQRPNFYTVGPTDPAFEEARPFMIDAGRNAQRSVAERRGASKRSREVRELA